MADYSSKTQSDNLHLANGTTARFVHVDSNSPASVTVRSTKGRLLRVILNQNGNSAGQAVLRIRNGSTVVASIAGTAATGTYEYGIYCDTSIIVEPSGTVDATIVYAP